MKNDKAIDVLNRVHNEKQSRLPLELVEKFYEIEKKFIFERESEKSIPSLEGIVKEYVDSEIKKENNENGE